MGKEFANLCFEFLSGQISMVAIIAEIKWRALRGGKIQGKLVG